jgi:hypothetical protein
MSLMLRFRFAPLLLLVLASVWGHSLRAQLYFGSGIPCPHPSACGTGLVALEANAFTYTPAPAWLNDLAERDASFVVTYTNFPADAMLAFDAAVDIWSAFLTSDIPIHIDATWESLAAGTLAQAGPNNLHENFQGAAFADTYYAAALANALHGTDLSSQSDLACSFNSTANWYFGLDGQTPAGHYDFITAALHEIGHGVGFIGSAYFINGFGFLGTANTPYVYDHFTETADSIALLDISNGSSALGNALTSDQLYWSGDHGSEGVGGGRPRLHAPASYESGSSYSHLNETTYPAGSPNALMTPALNAAESNHNPGPALLGMFEDMGWVIGGCQWTDIALGTQTACNEELGTYSQEITLSYQASPTTGLIQINGGLYLPTESPQTINITGLQADGFPVDVSAHFTAEPTCSAIFEGAFVAPIGCQCITDLSGNGLTDVQDLLILLADFGCLVGCSGDVTGDGASSIADILTMLSAFGQPCSL